MAHLSVCLFGSFEVTLDGEAVGGFASDKVRALLAYLAAEADRPHRRETLAGLLWSDYPESSARTSLRRALANLRTVIGDQQASPSFLSVSRQTIQFNCAGDAWCDVMAFGRAMAAGDDSPQEIDCLEEASALYRGEFLEGFSLGDCVAFEEWLLLKRERLRREALAALHHLAAYYEEQGEYTRALPYARRQVDLEPWHEEAQRQLMRLLALSGQQGLAVAQYQACRRALAEQLDVEPAAETTRLVEQIRAGAMNAATWVEEPPPARKPPPPLSPLPQRPPGRRITGAKPVWVVAGLLLLVLVSALVLFATRGWFSGAGTAEQSRSLDSFTTQVVEGRIVGPCENTTLPQICVYEAPSRRRLLMTDSLPFAYVESPSWSPDGQQIVFGASMNPEDALEPDCDLYVIRADGSHLRPITGGPANDVMPAWSPDGAWIAFHRSGALWLVRPDGSEAQPLWEGKGRLVLWPAWSPDSQQIAFALGTSEQKPTPHEIWVVDRQGAAPQMVGAFEFPLAETALVWDPQGQNLAFRLTAQDREETLLVAAGGTGEPVAIDTIPPSWFPSFWPRWGRGNGSANQ
jgi:DNA-binding SARP family transcriptional activator